MIPQMQMARKGFAVVMLSPSPIPAAASSRRSEPLVAPPPRLSGFVHLLDDGVR
jgi:hypothetical protein